MVVANKFQTGFDEPLLQSMYVDKKLGGVQCIQTLSRLNRTTGGKNRTFVLDFKNEPQDINDSFQRFYKSLVLEGETDPNILYDYLREIKEFNLYTSEDINQFCKSFLNPYREGDEELTQITDPVVDDFKNLETEEENQYLNQKFSLICMFMVTYLKSSNLQISN